MAHSLLLRIAMAKHCSTEALELESGPAKVHRFQQNNLAQQLEAIQ